MKLNLRIDKIFFRIRSLAIKVFSDLRYNFLLIKISYRYMTRMNSLKKVAKVLNFLN